MTTTMDLAGGNFGQGDGAGFLRHKQAGKLNYRLRKHIHNFCEYEKPQCTVHIS